MGPVGRLCGEGKSPGSSEAFVFYLLLKFRSTDPTDTIIKMNKDHFIKLISLDKEA
jgi:hypothetical protein